MLSFIVPLALAFLAVRVIVRLVSGAEERGYLDIVLTAPVARRVLVAGACRRRGDRRRGGARRRDWR